jgi:glycosyltransferase involved in cell wall biosynthesis
MRVLALLPSFYGEAGSAINERQLIEALASKVDRCYVITLVGFTQVFGKQRNSLKISLPKNLTVIPFPLPQVNVLLIHLAMIMVSCLISALTLITGLCRRVNLIYVRYSFLAIGFLTFHSTAKKTIVKMPAMIEDEVKEKGICRLFIEKIVPFVDRATLARAKRILVSSRSFYDELVKRRSFIRNDEPLIIPAGINLGLIEEARKQISEGSPPNTIQVGFLGSLSWWQGVDILVRALFLLKDRVPNLRLVIIGDGQLRDPIEKLCRSLNIPLVISGFLPHVEALKLLSSLDVMVLPRRRTPTTESVIPIKVVEAWALGVPVIVTKHQVFLDYQIRDYEDVIYCEPDPNSVANAIHTLLTNDELRKKLKTNGPKLARQFDYNKIAERLLKA